MCSALVYGPHGGSGGYGPGAACSALSPLTLTSFSACEAEFPLPVAVEMFCGAKRTWGAEGGRERHLASNLIPQWAVLSDVSAVS